MDRRWISTSKPGDPEYIAGVKDFINFAVENSRGRTRLPCPCFKCHNFLHKKVDEILNHLSKSAFDRTYTVWIWHGEDKERIITDNVHENPTSNEGDRIEDMLREVQDKFDENPATFETLLGDSEKPLYTGCKKYTRLSSVLRLYNLKAVHGLSDTAFTELLEVVKDMLPDDNVLPSRTYEAKKILCSMSLPYEKIHACRNDCILFRNDYVLLKNCPTCNVSRYKKEGVSAKVLWYFPIIPRFHRIFSNPKDAELLLWHHFGRIKDDKLRHPAEGQVHVLGATEVTLNHFTTLSQEYRRVTITKDIVPTVPLPCPNEECSVVCQALCTFVSWPANLIFLLKKLFDKQPTNVVVSHSPSSQTSATKTYDKNDKFRVKVSSDLCKALKKEALMLKKRHGNIIISIPDDVFYHEQDVRFDHEDLLYWCYQKEIGSPHMSIFMKYLSESCKKDGISGMYGFCDSNYTSPLNPTLEQDRSDYVSRVFGCNGGKNINQLFFAPFHENRHWMLAAISPWNGTVFWLDPAGDNIISEFAQRIINEGIIKFSILHRKDIKKIKKNPEIRWKKIKCPRQAQGTVDCGYYVCRYIIEIIESRRPFVPDQYLPGTSSTYSQESIDELKDMWAEYFFSQIEDDEEEDSDNIDNEMDVRQA